MKNYQPYVAKFYEVDVFVDPKLLLMKAGHAKGSPVACKGGKSILTGMGVSANSEREWFMLLSQKRLLGLSKQQKHHPRQWPEVSQVTQVQLVCQVK